MDDFLSSWGAENSINRQMYVGYTNYNYTYVRTFVKSETFNDEIYIYDKALIINEEYDDEGITNILVFDTTNRRKDAVAKVDSTKLFELSYKP